MDAGATRLGRQCRATGTSTSEQPGPITESKGAERCIERKCAFMKMDLEAVAVKHDKASRASSRRPANPKAPRCRCGSTLVDKSGPRNRPPGSIRSLDPRTGRVWTLHKHAAHAPRTVQKNPRLSTPHVVPRFQEAHQRTPNPADDLGHPRPAALAQQREATMNTQPIG